MFIRAKDSKEFEMENSRPISFPAQNFLKDVLGLDVDIHLFVHIRAACFFLTLYCSSQIRTVYASFVFRRGFWSYFYTALVPSQGADGILQVPLFVVSGALLAIITFTSFDVQDCRYNSLSHQDQLLLYLVRLFIRFPIFLPEIPEHFQNMKGMESSGRR
jgi:hypothetical protein